MNNLVVDNVVTLYKSLSPIQLAGVVSLNWRGFPSLESGQCIFAPKLHREYAEMLARQLEMASYQAGFVVSFRVYECFLQQFERGSVAYYEHEEYRIPVTAIDALNRSLVGKIELLSGFATPSVMQYTYPDSGWAGLVNQ